ncbi:MAG: hypothetical protein ACI3ZO_02710 [Candidatus Cryptobacteroides sp.]|nr:hypothetical protein [Bacteroidales bacterium]
MTKIILKYLPALFAIASAFLSGCSKGYDPDPDFLASDRIMLKIGGTEKMVYAPDNCQIGFNRSLKQFRVCNDNMSEYYILTCNALPVEVGQNITCSLKYASGASSYIRGNLSFRVEKMDAEGNIRLWCKDKGIGVGVCLLN